MGRTYGILGGKQPRQYAYKSHPWTSNPVLTVQAPSALGPQAPLQSLIRVKQSTTHPPNGQSPLGPLQCTSHPEVVPLPPLDFFNVQLNLQDQTDRLGSPWPSTLEGNRTLSEP